MPGIEYLCARARGLRSRFLGPAGAAALLARPDLRARLELLGKSDYGWLLPAAAATPREATWRLRGQLHADASLFLRLLDDGRTRELLAAVLATADVWALETILRAVDRGVPAAEVVALLEPTPSFDAAALRELAGQRGVKGVVDLLATWGSPWARPLDEARRETLVAHDLLPLGVALARAHFARGFALADRRGEDGGVVGRHFALLVDLTNAATLLRMGGRRDLFLTGGHALGAARFRRLAALDVVAMRAALAADRGLRLGEAVNQPFLLDRVMQRRRLEHLRREARLHPLSIAVPLFVLAEREDDIRRIRLVLEAAEVGVPAAELAELLAEAA